MKLRSFNCQNFPKYLFIFLLIIVMFKHFYDISDQATIKVEDFIISNGNYERMRYIYNNFATTAEAKKIIPPKSLVKIPESVSGIEVVAAKYGLYPLKLSSEAQYLIDLNHSVKNSDEFPKKKQLRNDTYVFAKNNASFLKRKPISEVHFPFNTLLIFFALFLVQVSVGRLILHRLRIPINESSAIWIIGTSFLAGFCSQAITVWILLLFGLDLSLALLIILSILMIAVLLPNYLRNKTPRERIAWVTTTKNPSNKTITILFIILLGLITFWIACGPVKGWDAMNSWAIKAKIIYHEQNIDLQYTIRSLIAYPILWPIHLAMIFTTMGSDYDETIMWSSALFFLIFLIQLSRGFSLLRIKPNFIIISFLVYFTFCIFGNPTATALPENAFLALLTSLLVSLCLWIQSPKERGYLKLSIIMALGLNLIKLEGSIATAIIIFSLILIKKKELLKKEIWPFLLTLILTILPPMLWILWTKMQGFTTGVIHIRSSFTLEKFLIHTKSNFMHFLLGGELIIFFLAFAYFRYFPNNRKWNTLEYFLLWISIFLLLFRWVATLGWDINLILNALVFQDAAWRLFLHASPSLILLFASRAFYRNE